MNFSFEAMGKRMKLIFRLLTVFLVLGFISACLLIKVLAESSAEDISSIMSKAEQGDIEAQYNLAEMYTQGKGVPQDYKQALTWYEKAAEQGDARAQAILGSTYRVGRGVPQDDKQAFYWTKKAAEQGDANAQFFLAGYYYKGKGVLQDYTKAYAWFNLAASQGVYNADQFRDSLIELMTPSQIEEGQKLSIELYDKTNNQTR